MRLFPGLLRLRRYESAWFRGDVLAGVTVAAYLIPQVMAYATVAGLPPVAGLWAALGAIALYAVFGSSPQLSFGPEATTALLTATAVAPLAVGNAGRYAALAATLALIVAGLAVLAWVLRLGFLADLLSRPVLVGYMTGVAVIMAVGQLSRITGVPVDGDGVIPAIGSFLSHLGQAHAPTVLLSAVLLALLMGGSRLFPRAPVPLFAVLAGAGAVALLDLQERGIAVVGDIPQGIPVPGLPAFRGSDIGLLLLPALGVTVVAYTDSMLAARVFATRNGYQVDANAELLALGAGNAAAGVLHGFPISSSSSRTVIGDSMGSRTQLYSLVAMIAVIGVLLAGGTVLASFPSAALGALVVWAAIQLIDVAEFRRLARFRRSELLLALATVAGVLLFDILYGVLFAVGASLADLLRRAARPHDAVLGNVPGLAGMHDVDDYPDARQVPGLLIYRYDSTLFFANAENFKRRALAAVDSAPTRPRWLVLDAEAVVAVDLTAVDALVELRAELRRRDIELAWARVKYELESDLHRAGVLSTDDRNRMFATLPTAVQAFQRWESDQPPPPRS